MFYNFENDEYFNKIRAEMNAPLLSALALLSHYHVMKQEDLQALLTTGLSVQPNTLMIKHHLLYYQDILVSINLTEINESFRTRPRLHIAYCKTLQKMLVSQENRTFTISRQFHQKRKLQDQNTSNYIKKDLHVCKYCLELIHWNVYHVTLSDTEKSKAVNCFQLKTFYQKYSHTTFDHLLNNIILSSVFSY